MNKIKVLIVDDSKTMIAVLQTIFSEETDIEVVGCAEDGEQAVMLTQRLKPNVVIMDILMPKLDGFEATKQIMDECPTPVIILSSLMSTKQIQTTSQALLMGALVALPKFTRVSTDDFDRQKQIFLKQVRLLSNANVGLRNKSIKKTQVTIKAPMQSIKILGLGVSTGGPEALSIILSSLDMNFPVPIVVVLHISHGFLEGFVDLLQKRTKLNLKIAEHQEVLCSGTLYFAPDKCHLAIQQGERPRAILTHEPPVGQFKPAITKLFSSLAVAYPGKSVAGLLTGMGRDGVEGLAAMKAQGCYTFVQSAETCVVAGMVNAAKQQDIVDDEVDLHQVAVFLKMLLQDKRNA